jgi:alpha-glucosidase
MLDWARQIAVSKNFVLVIKNSNPNTVILTCDLAGKYRCGKRVLPGAEIRSIYKPRTDTPTRKCGCPFELIGVRIKDKNGWVLKVKCGQHNHGLANSLVAHPYAGRLTAEQKEFVKEKFLYLANPKMVLQELRAKYPGNVTSIRQIYNMREKLILEDCGELTVTQWSLKFLKDRGYIVHPRRVSGSDVMNVLFFVHPTGLRMLKMFPYVVIMDSTYKTNR